MKDHRDLALEMLARDLVNVEAELHQMRRDLRIVHEMLCIALASWHATASELQVLKYGLAEHPVERDLWDDDDAKPH